MAGTYPLTWNKDENKLLKELVKDKFTDRRSH